MPGTITRAVQAFEDGDEDAGVDIDRFFRAQLLAVVRSWRPREMRARIDSYGVVNAAMQKFLSGLPKGRFPELGSRENVRLLLTTLVVRMLHDELDHHSAQKRSARRDVQLDVAGSPTAADGRQHEAVFDLFEELRMVVCTAHPRALDVLEAKVEGLTNLEVSEQMGMGLSTVEFVCRRMRAAWQRRVESEADK